MSEIGSSMARDHTQSIMVQPGIQSMADGRPTAVREIGLHVTFRKLRQSERQGALASVSLRGTSPEAFEVRPSVRIVDGRAREPGTTELVVRAQVAKQFPDTRLGQRIRFGNRDWTVGGILAANGNGFESEVWGDADQLMRTFHRTAFSSVTLRLTNPAAWDTWKARLENDPRFSLGVKRETELCEGKAATMVRLIRMTGLFLTTVFSIGAVLGATMTMSTSVAQRTTEIATLRTIQLTRAAIVQSFCWNPRCSDSARACSVSLAQAGCKV